MKAKTMMRVATFLSCVALTVAVVWSIALTHFRRNAFVQVKHKPGPGPGSDPWFIQTEFELIQSPFLLSNVITRLDSLPNAHDKSRPFPQRIQRLQRQLELRVVKGDEIEISVFASTPQAAARTANTIAVCYRDWCQSRPHSDGTSVRIISNGLP